MKPEKMPPEWLEKRLAQVATAVGSQAVDDFRAHIAALEGETATETERLKIAQEAQADALRHESHVREMWGRDQKERDTLRERVAEHERAAAQAIQVLEESAREVERLRERVKALEAKLREAREDARRMGGRIVALESEGPGARCRHCGDRRAEHLRRHHGRGPKGTVWYCRGPVERPFEPVLADAAESRLSDILQRAGDGEALRKVAETCAIMGGVGEWDEAIHADVVGRGAEDMLRDVSRGVARYILGPDATGAEKAPHPMEDTEGCGVCPGCTDEDWADSDLCQNPRNRRESPAEPSTAEAFATVRANLKAQKMGFSEDGETLTLLALLERRMGALVGAVRGVLGAGSDPLLSIAALRDLESALTDAPPVFTLEEVERALRDAYGPLAMVETVKECLAVRRKPAR